MRLFLAINLDAGVRHAIMDAAAPLRAAAPALRWVSDAKLHLTLKFLGQQPPESVDRLREALDDVAPRHRRFTMRLRQVGAFPNFRRARVVWMGVAHDARLELLHHDVEVACEARGFELDGRAFRPHITLARVSDGVPEDTLRQLSRAAKRVDLEQECTVESIDVMQSINGVDGDGAGSRYERLHAAPLRSS